MCFYTILELRCFVKGEFQTKPDGFTITTSIFLSSLIKSIYWWKKFFDKSLLMKTSLRTKKRFPILFLIQLNCFCTVFLRRQFGQIYTDNVVSGIQGTKLLTIAQSSIYRLFLYKLPSFIILLRMNQQ